MTDEEREDLLQLLANYENMARGVESLIDYLRTEPSLNLDTSRYKGPLQDIIELVPVWRTYASALRVKFMLDRRAVPTRLIARDTVRSALLLELPERSTLAFVGCAGRPRPKERSHQPAPSVVPRLHRPSAAASHPRTARAPPPSRCVDQPAS